MVEKVEGASRPQHSLRALLLTDIVDSTACASRLGDEAMSTLWQAHDRAARDLLRRWRGREIDRSDGFLLLFDSVGDAVGFAIAYHGALAMLEVPLKARAGVHLGPVQLRENLAEDVAIGAKPVEVEGLAKALAARLMSLAQGGQTLVSAPACEALDAAAFRVQRHGHWRMRGLAEPIEVFEVGDDDAPFAPPPDSAKAYRVVRQGEFWLPLRDLPHALPAERDAFVGRHDTLLDIVSHFEQGARLVSLLGVGGCGKTRLATRFAWTWLGDFPGGCWFCDLAQARDIDGVVGAVAQGLDVPLGREDPVLQLGNAIAGRGECLLILDNFEQVARHAESTLGRWLERAPQARFIVTSREILGIAGEHVIALAPLSGADARELFLCRAAAARADFDVEAEDRTAIGPLVTLLDNLPLAIELCAARVRIMPPRLLLQRMDERFRLLTSSGGRHDRQATLRATFDWSWGLLTLFEKLALAQLSVFEGGFTLAAAEDVVDLGTDAAAPWVPDVVQLLVDKSFVIDRRGLRFGLLVSVQEYAQERLRVEFPHLLESVQQRHCRHFAMLDEASCTAQSCADLANLVCACRASVRAGAPDLAAGALRGAWSALLLRGPYRMGLELAAPVLALAELPPAARAWAQWIEASAQRAIGEPSKSEAVLASALDTARAVGDRACEARVLIGLGAVAAAAGRMAQGLQHQQAALALARASGDRVLECETLNSLGTLLDQSGEPRQARQHFEAAIALARTSGLRRWEGGALGNLGLWFASQGHLAEAQQYFESSLEAATEVGDRRWEGNALSNLGLLHQMSAHPGAARTALLAAVEVARAIGLERMECVALGNLGIVDGGDGRFDDARRHFEEAVAVARRVGDRRAEAQFLGHLGLLLARQGGFDDARERLAVGQALLESLQDRPSLALLLAQSAEVEGLAGDTAPARVAAVRANALARELDAAPGSELGLQLERVTRWLEQPPARDAGTAGAPAA